MFLFGKEPGGQHVPVYFSLLRVCVCVCVCDKGCTDVSQARLLPLVQYMG